MSSSTGKTKQHPLSKFILLSAAAVAALALTVQPAAAQKPVSIVDFDLHVNPKFAACVGVAGNPAPSVHVNVKRGKLADTLTIEGNNIRPHLAFDMFTVQRSNLLSNGNADPNFTNFGLAWPGTRVIYRRMGRAISRPPSRPFCSTRFLVSIRMPALRRRILSTLASGSTIRTMPTRMGARSM